MDSPSRTRRATRLASIALGAVVAAQTIGWGAIAWLFTRPSNAAGNPTDGLAMAVIGTFIANLVGIASSVASVVAGRNGARRPRLAIVALVLAAVGFAGTFGLTFLWAFAAAGTK